MKSKLLLERIPHHGRERQCPITQALPFFKSGFGTYIHRVRSGSLYNWGEDSHIAIQFWCGASGFISKKKRGELMATTPEHAIHCAVCEGRAIGAGMCGTRIINGKHVLFNPRA